MRDRRGGSGPPAAGFHGSRVVAAALLANLVTIGCSLGIYSVFVGPIAADLGASQAQAGLGSSLWQLALGLGSPLLGPVLARRSARPIMIAGACLFGAGLVAISRLGDPLAVGCVYGLCVGGGTLLAGPLPASTLVASWYVRRRGRALGFATAGMTLGTALVPPLAAWLVGRLGWRDALALIGLGAIALLVPVLRSWVVSRPEELGQAPDGLGPREPSAPPHATAPPSSRELLRDGCFWRISAIFGLLFAAGQVLVIFLVPYARHLGMTLQGGAFVLASRAGAALVGRLGCGALADRLDLRRLLGAAIAAQIALWLGLVHVRGVAAFVALGIVQGVVSGALTPLQGALLGRAFGRGAFATALGLAGGVGLPLGFFAAPAFGAILDASGGDFGFAFECLLPPLVAALALVPGLRLPARE